MKQKIKTNQIFYKQNILRIFFIVNRLISWNLWREIKNKLQTLQWQRSYRVRQLMAMSFSMATNLVKTE